MHRRFGSLILVLWLGILLAPSSRAAASDGELAISAHTQQVDGVALHYLKAGKGPTVILLHGYTQTSHMWKGLIPQLATRFTVIAPDLPGIGDSAVLPEGLTMKNAAQRIHGLVRALGVEKARVVGHDIGLMVAYAYAALYPAETEKLAVLDAFLPGISGWQNVYDSPSLWHFRFHGAAPEALVKGRERIYYDYYWDEFAADRTHSIPEADRKIYTAAYARPGHMHAGWAYFASFPETGKDFALLAKTKLTMPVLSIGGKQSSGELLGQQMKLVSNDATVVVLENCGHWILEEQTKATTDALLKFL